MTIEWTGFPASVDATASDILVGLAGGTANARFNVSSLLLKANNLSDVASKTTAFNNLSPLTTKGDIIWQNGSNNVRLAVGSLNQILVVGASSALTWVNNPGLLIANNLSDVASLATTLTNLGLAPASNPSFAALTATTSVTTPSVISSGLNKLSVANALTAHSGGGQPSALGLTKAINRVTTVAVAGDSVKLPAALAGESIVVINAAAANAMDCFPASGEAINALTANTQLSIVANTSVMFNCAVNGTWNTIVTA